MPSTPPSPDRTILQPATPTSRITRAIQNAPLTPEQVRRIETNRLKAKAVREQREAQARLDANKPSTGTTTTHTATKRTYDSATKDEAKREDRKRQAANRPLDTIEAAQKFKKYVEYDLSKMSDTKGGFLSTIDDPHSLLASSIAEGKPANMTLDEWRKQQLRQKLQKEKEGAFEPAITKAGRKCWECGSVELDWKLFEVFKCRVCVKCREKIPDKYSLLTKTESREDYLLTDPELKDEELLPHMEKPNPLKSNWATMQLYLRYQVEEFAFKKWGSPEALDEEFEKRTKEQRRRKDEKFKKRLGELKRRTRVETWKKQGRFDGSHRGKHEHEWSEVIESGDGGMGVKTCGVCGMEVEEMVI